MKLIKVPRYLFAMKPLKAFCFHHNYALAFVEDARHKMGGFVVQKLHTFCHHLPHTTSRQASGSVKRRLCNRRALSRRNLFQAANKRHLLILIFMSMKVFFHTTIFCAAASSLAVCVCV